VKLERVQRGTAGTIHATFTQDGVATDPTPDSATVTLTRLSTGEELGPYDAYDQGEGAFSHTLSPTDSALLDTFTASWTVTYDGYEQAVETTVEVVGGFHFSIAEARATAPLDNTTKYSTARIVAVRGLVEEALEDACGCAFVPRYAHETLSGSGSASLLLRPLISRVRSATVDGTAFSDSDITSLSIGLTGTVYSAARAWSSGSNKVVVGYEHGYGYPPARVKHAALMLAKRWLIDGPVDDRATGFSNETGTYQLVTPGVRGAMFDVPEVNATVQQYSLAAGLA
jgi:hypothetical protein